VSSVEMGGVASGYWQVMDGCGKALTHRQTCVNLSGQVTVLRFCPGLVSSIIGTFELMVVSFLFWTGRLDHGLSPLWREFQF
jgi:hypothetical protein